MEKLHPNKENFHTTQNNITQSRTTNCPRSDSDNIVSENKISHKSFYSSTQLEEYRFIELDSYICIPISIDKKPVISWKNVKETPKHLFKDNHNIALLTGNINGITVVDIDLPKPDKVELDGMKMIHDLFKQHNGGKCLDSPICKTQSGGLHLYFKYDADIKTTTGVNGYSIDVRNDNALVVAPPSVGEKGPYVWLDGLKLSDANLTGRLTDIPQWLKEWLLSSKPKKIGKVVIVKRPIRDNKHDNTINKEYIYIYDTNNISILLNKLPIKYLNNYNDWFIVTSCLKSENLFDVWNEWSKKYKNYDEVNNIDLWNSITPNLNINYLLILAKNANIDVNPNTIRFTKRINFLTSKPDLQINKQYVTKEDIIIDNTNKDTVFINTTMVRSGCGTGKTTFACSLINDLIINNNYRLLSLSVRVSLAYQQVSNFEKNKLAVANYKKIASNIELNKQKNLVMQIDSLIRLNINSWNNIVIYLDEVSCLFSYILTSTTLNTKRMRVFNTLCELLVKASKILVTDADINDMVLFYFNKIGIKYHLIENSYKNPIKIPAHEYSSKEILLKLIEHQLLIDSPVIVCFDSKKEMDLTVERMKKYCEDNGLKRQLNNFVIYSSTEGDEDDFFHINDRWKNKNVFMTPKITIGVDYANKIPRNVYLIGLGNSINVIAYLQQIARCRNINELHYYIANKYQPLRYKCIDSVKEHFKGIIKDYDNLHCASIMAVNTVNNDDDIDVIDIDDVDDLSDWHSVKSDHEKLKIIIDSGNASKDFTQGGCDWTLNESLFNEMFFYNEYYDNILRSAPREQFRWMLEDKNFEIVYNNDDVEDNNINDIAQLNKVIKERVEENHEQLCQRALYNKLSSLTENEKKIREDAVRRAKYLKIDFNKKVQKKEWEKFLTDDVEFTRHVAYKLLMGPENKLDSKIAAQLEKDYKITVCNSLESKIKLIKKVEGILKVKTLDIDTQRDMGRFNEEVKIDEALLKLIKKTFRSVKANDKIASSFEHLYYQLIQLYKNVLGNDICTYKQITFNNEKHKKFNMNGEVLNEYINLSEL